MFLKANLVKQLMCQIKEGNLRSLFILYWCQLHQAIKSYLFLFTFCVSGTLTFYYW